MVTTGGEYNEICHWKLDGKGNPPLLLKKIVGVGQEFFSFALNEDQIPFSNAWTANFGQSDLKQEFDLFEKRFTNVSKTDHLPITAQNDHEIGTYNEGGYSIVNPKLIIKKGDSEIDTIIREYWNGNRHYSYTFAPNGMIFSGGSQGIMSAYDINGFERNLFIGHEEDIWGTSISSDGK